MRTATHCCLLFILTLVAAGPTLADASKRGDSESKNEIAQKPPDKSESQPTRAFARPSTDQLDDATRDVKLVMGIGLFGFIILIIGSYLWYEPRVLQKPYRPTKITKSHREKSLGGGDDFESRGFDQPTSEKKPDVDSDSFDFEYYYRSLEEPEDESQE